MCPPISTIVSRFTVGAMALALIACSEPASLAVELPDGLFDGRFTSAIVVVQSGPELGSRVLEAWAIDLQDPVPLRLETEQAEIMIRVLGYSEPLSIWALEPGRLSTGPSAGEDSEVLPEPLGGFSVRIDLGVDVTAAPSPEWADLIVPPNTTEIPLRIPPVDRCEWVNAESHAALGFEEDSIAGFIDLEDDNPLVTGYHRGPEENPRDYTGFAGRLRGFEQFDSVIDELPATAVLRIVRSPWGLFSTTTRGDLISFDDQAQGATVTRVFEPSLEHVRWTLSVGEDGHAMIFSRPDLFDDDTEQAWWVDLQTREVRSVDAPEIIGRAALHNASSVLVASGGTVYHYDGQAWTREQQGPDVRDIESLGDGRFAVIRIGGVLSIREADGRWTDWPTLFPGGLVANLVRRLPGDRWLIAADAGLAVVWMDDRWCQVLTGVGRTFLAAEISSDGQSAWLPAYSDSPRNPARIAHIRILRSPQLLGDKH